MYTAQRRVQFHQTDAAGLMHFASFFTMMEEAEHELLRSLDMSVVLDDECGRISFPRVSASCDFSRPIHFEDLVDIEVSVQRLGKKSVTYEFRFKHNGQEVARGLMTSVCCQIDQEPPQSIAIPQRIVEKLSIHM